MTGVNGSHAFTCQEIYKKEKGKSYTNLSPISRMGHFHQNPPKNEK